MIEVMERTSMGSIDKARIPPEWLVSQSYSWIKEGECQAIANSGVRVFEDSVLRSAALGRRYLVGGEDERHAREALVARAGREREWALRDAGEADIRFSAAWPGDASNPTKK